MTGIRAEIVVVGDVHGHWTHEDHEFLQDGSQDLALFVGDLGDENIEIVRDIATLDVAKAVMLGNHDAWASFSKKQPTQALGEIVNLLGPDLLAYAAYDLPVARLSIVGARPFSWGGLDIRSPEVYSELFGVHSIEESADRIVEAAASARFDDVLVLAHNGPYGLSGSPSSIWGKDFGKRPGGDWGDRDLAAALDRIAADGRRSVHAVVAGHMHHKLHPQIGGYRNRFARGDGVAYLNAAVVPRIRRSQDGTMWRHYLRIVWDAGALETVEEIWVDGSGEVRERFAARFKDLAGR